MQQTYEEKRSKRNEYIRQYRLKNKCIHNKRKSYCKECGGSDFCIHNIQKQKCIECGGSQICIHNKQKYQCKECGGSQICIHNIQKSTCKDCSPLQHLANLHKSSLNRIIKQMKILKTKTNIEYLGCSIEYFHDYIKSKMTEEMTSENIHYDHIKPITVFDLENEEDFLNCCHYTNIQPLLTTDNIKKSNKWSLEDELFWNENIKGKEYLPIYLPKRLTTTNEV